MEPDLKKGYETWDAFLAAWPLDRLRQMQLPDYTQAGNSQTFTAWIESRLDELGSIWGGSAFKFGIYSRKDKSDRVSGGGASYTADYGWYTKYGSSPEEAFAKVRSLVVEVAEAASRGDYGAIDAVDLGPSVKWKIAFHYQDRKNPGVIAVFLKKWLQSWLKGRVGVVPERMSELYRAILQLEPGADPLALGGRIWNEAAASDPAPPEPPGAGEVEPDGEPGPSGVPLNLVLYGPPGTGKTFLTTEIAVRICDGVVPEGRDALHARYRELCNLRRIRFVTFHPSFSYEEFVEGIRPVTDADGRVRYEVRAGVLKQAVTHARELFERGARPTMALDLKGRKLFKISLGDTSLAEEDWIFPDCLENGYVCVGFAKGIDFTPADDFQAIRERYLSKDPNGKSTDYAAVAVHYLKNEIRDGDLVLVSHGNRRFRAVGVATGAYRFQSRAEGYEHTRPVRWLWSSGESLPIEMVFAKNLSQMTIYLMDQSAVKWPALQELVAPRKTNDAPPNCVLIVDEINRANLAKTFGELITLLEPSKRLGGSDAQETELPYSGDRFGVPPNLHVIGTMNTADRSIALMDTALRRRFSFREMPPRPELLAADVDGVDLRALLSEMNARIENLFDRDHALGHSYLMEVASFDELVERFRGQIIPLLQEYFFEDWRKIQRVFNDTEQPKDRQIVQELETAGGGSASGGGRRFVVNPNISPAAVKKIYE